MTSPLETINEVLRDRNPFAKPPYLNAKDVWGRDFFDISSINARASDAVFQALEQIRNGQYSTTSIAITAQDGTGKTHIIGRLRHQLQNEGGGLFVYANKYGDLGQIENSFQRILAESLAQIGHQGVTQWQELAAAMTNHILNFEQPESQPLVPEQLIQKFQEANFEKETAWIAGLLKRYPQVKSIQDPDIARAILLTLTSESLYAIKWLSGQELSQAKANSLQLPSQNQSFEATLQILDLISEYYELVVCFDELDRADAFDENNGLHVSQIVASLVKDLFQNLDRGIILSVMMPAQWINKIKQLPDRVHHKISAQGEPLQLSYIDRDSAVEFVSRWLGKYYEQENLVPPAPLYPFDEQQLLQVADGKPTVRELLKWCRANCVPIEPQDPVEEAFNAELALDWESVVDDNHLLADALYYGFMTLVGKTVERVTVETATHRVIQDKKKDPYLNFKIIGQEGDKKVSIGVGVLQYAGGNSLGAGLKRLNDYDKFSLTRGCLVRSESKKMTSYIEQKYLIPLVGERDGKIVDLKAEEIKPLLAIRAVHQKRDVDYKITEQQILDYIEREGAKTQLGESNPLLREILSNPSPQIPTTLIKDEPVFDAKTSQENEIDLDVALDEIRRAFSNRSS